MEVEETKPAAKKGRGGKRAAVNNLEEGKSTKQAKIGDANAMEAEAKEEVNEEAKEDGPKTPPQSQAPPKEFLSPLMSTKKLANAARTFLTPVKSTPGKALITPRSLKPAQGKILPKSPLVFSFDSKPQPRKSEVAKDERYILFSVPSFFLFRSQVVELRFTPS
jgi:hypothetical protein